MCQLIPSTEYPKRQSRCLVSSNLVTGGISRLDEVWWKGVWGCSKHQISFSACALPLLCSVYLLRVWYAFKLVSWGVFIRAPLYELLRQFSCAKFRRERKKASCAFKLSLFRERVNMHMPIERRSQNLGALCFCAMPISCWFCFAV